MSDNLPKPGDPNYPTDPILVKAIEAERTRRSQTDAQNKADAAKAKADAEAKQIANAKSAKDKAKMEKNLGDGLSSILSNRALSDVTTFEYTLGQAADAYAKNPNAESLKKYNEAKTKFVKATNDYVKLYKDDRSPEELFGASSVGAQAFTDTKTKPAGKGKTTKTETPLLLQGAGTAEGAKTTKLSNGLDVQTLTNGVKIYKTKNGSQITVNADGGIEFAVNKAGKPLTEKQINSVAGMVAAGTAKPSTSPAGSTGTGTGLSTGSLAVTAPVRKTKQELADDYKVQMAVINSDPSLVRLFNQAVATQMTPTAFAAALRNSDFYLDHGAAWADAQIKKLGDPGDWKDQVKDAKTLVQQNAVDLGMQLDPQEVEHLANAALHSSHGDAKQITTTWLNTHIATYGKITGKGGTTADTINTLKESSGAYGVQHSEDWYVNAAKSIVQKKATIEDYDSQIKDLAKTKYAPFADQIDKGISVKQIASPYINSMANILEIPAESIGLNDHTINRALTSLDSKGQPMAQPLWQFETNLRQDPRWATTKNANDTLSSLSNSILKTFGLVS